MSDTQSPPPAGAPAPAAAPATKHSLSHIEGQVVKYASEAYGWGETEVKALLAKIASLIHPKPTLAGAPQPTTAPSSK